MFPPKTVNGSPFHVDESLKPHLRDLDEEVTAQREDNRLSAVIQRALYEQTRLDEVYHSNRIEGNRLTYSETRRVIQAGDAISGKPPLDQLETANLAAALDFAQEVAFDKTKPVTQNVLREFHAVLMAGIEEDAGRYRKTEVVIQKSSHSTPAAFLVPQFMTELSDFLAAVASPEAELAESPIFCAAAAHALFAQIHPFSDGNGRTARALMNLILRRNGCPPSIIRESQRDHYIDALECAWPAGDLTPLVKLVCKSIGAS